MAASSSLTKPIAQAFEFTKRKRWSETLFSELSETIVFVLSPTCKVLFCGSAIVGLLGWKEDQLVDADLSSFIEDEDQENFRWTFTESLRTGQDLFIYVRFKYEQPPSNDAESKAGQLFELKGHPHYVEGQSEPQCLFLTAMPYPSRNVGQLNSFLDLRIENDRLTRRLNELKGLEVSSQSMEMPSSPQAQYLRRFNDSPMPSNNLYPHSGSALLPKVEGIAVPSLNDPVAPGDDGEDGNRKKKPKKMVMSDEQRVCITCGRTDSPEWRKGPSGPKTLCNACGLRWAKRSRKPESDSMPGPSSKSQDPGDDSSSSLHGSHRMVF